MEEDEIKQKCHIALKEAAQQEKSLDKEKALNDPSIYCAVFDLEKSPYISGYKCRPNVLFAETKHF